MLTGGEGSSFRPSCTRGRLCGHMEQKGSKSAQCFVFNTSYNLMSSFCSWRLAIVDSASILPIIPGLKHVYPLIMRSAQYQHMPGPRRPNSVGNKDNDPGSSIERMSIRPSKPLFEW